MPFSDNCASGLLRQLPYGRPFSHLCIFVLVAIRGILNGKLLLVLCRSGWVEPGSSPPPEPSDCLSYPTFLLPADLPLKQSVILFTFMDGFAALSFSVSFDGDFARCFRLGTHPPLTDMIMIFMLQKGRFPQRCMFLKQRLQFEIQ